MLLNHKNVFQPVRFLCRGDSVRPTSSRARKYCHCLAVSMFLICAGTLAAQKPSQDAALKYDLHTETKTKGIIDEVKVLPAGSKKDLRELIIRSGEDKVHIYVCPQPFEEEMGITFSKGDELAITGSKLKQEDSDVILVRELVKGTDTLVFRDGKGNPVWDPRTGK